MTTRRISLHTGRLAAAAACLTIAFPGMSTAQSARWPARPVQRTIPLGPEIERAYRAGTRDSTGSPGKNYWQQSVDYDIDARLDVDSAVLHGTEHVTLHNTSPDTLHAIVLRLLQPEGQSTVGRPWSKSQPRLVATIISPGRRSTPH